MAAAAPHALLIQTRQVVTQRRESRKDDGTEPD